LTNRRNPAHNIPVVMTRPAFSVVLQHYRIAKRGELCFEVVA
jgi:hypothetical protein